jgi:hypothetical protein
MLNNIPIEEIDTSTELTYNINVNYCEKFKCEINFSIYATTIFYGKARRPCSYFIK